MSNERRSSGLGSRPSIPSAAEETPSPVAPGRGLRASAPPAAPEPRARSGLGSGPPPQRDAPEPRASQPSASPLRGDSLGPIPQLQKLTPKAAAQWIYSSPLDHFGFLDIPQSRRDHVPLSEWSVRAGKRVGELRHWAGLDEQERQLLGLRAEGMIERLERAVSDETSLRAYFTEFGEGTVQRKAREFYENDQQIDEGEYGQVLAEAARWQISDARALEIVREVVPEFVPPKRSRKSTKAGSKNATWVPLVGRFRSSPSSLAELHEAMVTEVPAAQELLGSGLLSFHLSQQKEAGLAQVADRVVQGYDRRESLMVWDFLWSTGYPFLHAVGLPPVDGLAALVAACDGRSTALVDPVRSGQLALWAERVAGAPELARIARPNRNVDPREQARRSLWFAGDKRLQLASGEVVATLAELEDAMLKTEAAAQAAVNEAAGGSIFEWLRATGMGELAQSLESLGRGRSALYGRYLLVWASGRVRGLPLWQDMGSAHVIDDPGKIRSLNRARLLAVWNLLEADVLGLWSSVLRAPEQGSAWAQVLAAYRGAPESLRIAALRWSAGAEGILASKGVVRNAEELFALFEDKPSDVASLYADGVIEAWARRSLPASPLLSEVPKLSPPLRTVAALWCLGYPTLTVGHRRIDSLEALAGLPDDAQPDLDAAIASGALAFWRNARYPDRAPALAGPLDGEAALLAVGAIPAMLNVSVRSIELGDVIESTQRIENITIAASGSRGRVTVALRSTHPGVALINGAARHRYGDPPLVIGPLWAAPGHSAQVSVEVTALPNGDGDGGFEVTPTNGAPAFVVPVRWQTHFPSGTLALQASLGLLVGGFGALVARPVTGVLFNDILYVRDDHGEVARAIAFGQMNSGAVVGLGFLPGLVATVFFARYVYNKRAATDVNGAVGAAFAAFMLALGCFMSLFGWAILISYAGLDMVGHRLRAIFGSEMSLGSSALLGWIVVFSLLGAALRASRVLRAQERPGLARAVLALPLVILGLLLVT